MNFIKNIDTRKFFGSIIGGVSFICCILYFTYAYYEWRSSDTVVDLTIVDLSAECVVGAGVNVSDIGPVLDYKDGYKASFTITGTSASPIPLTLEISEIDKELLVDYFKYVLVYDVDGGTNYNYDSPVASGDFSDMIVGTNLIVDNIPSAMDTTYSYQFIVYIDGVIYNNSNIRNKSLVSNLILGNC